MHTLGCTRPRADRPKQPVGEGLPVVVGGEHRGQLHTVLFHRFYNLQPNVRQDGGRGHTPSTGRMRCRVGSRTQDWLGGATPCRDPGDLPLLEVSLDPIGSSGPATTSPSPASRGHRPQGFLAPRDLTDRSPLLPLPKPSVASTPHWPSARRQSGWPPVVLQKPNG